MKEDSIPVTYTPQQIAEKLGVTVPTVRRYINAGKLKATKIGRKITRITKEDYIGFVKGR